MADSVCKVDCRKGEDLESCCGERIPSSIGTTGCAQDSSVSCERGSPQFAKIDTPVEHICDVEPVECSTEEGDNEVSRSIDGKIKCLPEDEGATSQRHEASGCSDRTITYLPEGQDSQTLPKKDLEGKTNDAYVDIEKGLTCFHDHVKTRSSLNDDERACRVCSMPIVLGMDDGIVLGCACKNDLSIAHRTCAEQWFKLRGNVICEICSHVASNLPTSLLKDIAQAQADAMEQPAREQPDALPVVRRDCWNSHPIRRYILACILLAFIIYWLMRSAYLT